MTRSIPWLRVFIEGVVIVGSILLAFGIDAWWEGRQERAEERELLADLHAEFGVTRGLLEGSILSHGMLLSAATTLSSPGALIEGYPPDSIAGMSSRTLKLYSTFYPASGALDAALTSGKIGVLSDPALRAGLAGWPRAVREFQEQEESVREWLSQVSLTVSAQIPGLGSTMLANLGSPSEGLPYEATEVTDESHDQMIRFHSSELGRSYSSDRAVLEWYAVRDGERLLTELDELIRALGGAIGG